MEPTTLLENLDALVGPESLGPTSHPQVGDFAALKGQPDVALTDTEQGRLESDGSLPDAVTKAPSQPLDEDISDEKLSNLERVTQKLNDSIQAGQQRGKHRLSELGLGLRRTNPRSVKGPPERRGDHSHLYLT